jgi:hypothetical protein
MSIKVTINLVPYYDRRAMSESGKSHYLDYHTYVKQVDQQREDYLASLCEEERELVTGLFEKVDEQIASIEQYLAKLKMMRQGYEQQYLPAPDKTAPLKRPVKFEMGKDNG